MKLFSEYGYETKYHMGKANEVVDAWSRKRGVKPKQVRDICRMIQAKISEKMLVLARLYVYEAVARHGVHVTSIPDSDGMYIEVLTRDVEVVRNASSYGYCLPSIERWSEKSLKRREIIKRDMRIRDVTVRVEVGDRVLLKVSAWKGVVHFAYRLRLRFLEELSSVHDTFHVSNLKKCLADAIFHVPLYEIKVDKTLRFIEEPLEIMDREIKKLKRRKTVIVKVRWSSKRIPEFTWEHKDQMRINYPQLFVDRVVEPAS
nr:putative reverse transcriptase domain-containing protein [Tanacetum cinerariifolium]